MQTEFFAVPPDNVLSVWTKVAPLFDKLVTRQNYSSLEEIFTKIGVNKTHLLWVAWEKDNLDNVLLALLTCIHDNILIISCCGGDKIDTWLEHFKTLERFAIDNDCDRIQIRSGRKGWAKPLEQFNMKVTAYTFEKSLNKE